MQLKLSLATIGQDWVRSYTSKCLTVFADQH
jgi:hypothetical protein